jgi:hypothetical protein
VSVNRIAGSHDRNRAQDEHPDEHAEGHPRARRGLRGEGAPVLPASAHDDETS